MAIFMMCDAATPGAVFNKEWSRPATEDKAAINIYLVESHKGLVLETREYNMRDDSDFYAIVWNPEKQEPERVNYASTRGWTYPNSATVDATPDVRAAYEAYQARQEQAARDRRARSDAMTPTKGKRVTFCRGTTTKIVAGPGKGERTKIDAGTAASVFWYGEQREFGAMPRGGYKEHGRNMRRLADSLVPPADGVRDGFRVGVELADGRRVFTAATNVKVSDAA
jgi:hypothetical protein